MLGWEFPPFISGGLGTACHGLTDALQRQDTRVLFVLPRTVDTADSTAGPVEETDKPSHDLRVAPIPSELTDPYDTNPARADDTDRAVTARASDRSRNVSPHRSSLRVIGVGSEDGYDGDLVRKIRVFTNRCLSMARRELFDVVHAHDWMTFPAAECIARISGRPLIVHVHATEFDRSGARRNTAIYEIERRGMNAADKVVAVSHRTMNMIIDEYGVTPAKVTVVHNGIDRNGSAPPVRRTTNGYQTVLFLGRVTMQKGPEYFVRAAARVAQHVPNARFVIGGTGDLVPDITRLTRTLGISDRVEFPGFLRGDDVDRAYHSADVYVMPSVSEPFGLTALEAVTHGVPVILSKTSGVAEVLSCGALQVDYWDTELMARMIVSVLRYPGLADTLRRCGAQEVAQLTWDRAASACVRLYNELASRPEFRSAATRDDVMTTEIAPALCATT